MEGWVTKTINDCCEILDHLRIPLNGQQREKILGSIPYYGANGVQGYIDKYIFDEDLILIAEDGGYFEEFATRPIAYKISGKSWVNNHAHVLRAKKGFDQDFIFYSLAHKNILVTIVGGTRSKLNQAELKSITIEFPPIKDEQTAIARILSTVDKAIEQTEHLIAKYQRIKTGLMQNLLTRGIDEHGRIRSEATHRFKESPLGRIPEEWEAVELAKLYASPIRDFGSFSMTNLIEFVDEGVPFIKSEIIFDNFIDYENIAYIPQKVHKLLHKSWVLGGNILLTKIGAIGRVAIYDGRFGVCNSNAASAKIDIKKDKADNEYISSYLASEGVKSYFKENIISTPPRINLGEINKIPVPLPELEEQRRISVVISRQDNLIKNEQKRVYKFHSLKTALMHDLLSGRVRVPSDMIGRTGKTGGVKTA